MSSYVNLDQALSTIAARLAPTSDMMEQYENMVNDWLADVDQTEIVRCKDCKHYEPINNDDHGYCVIDTDNWCRGDKVYPDDYCSYGERKDG